MAAPTVGAVLADILPYLGVAKNSPEGQQILMEDYTDLTRSDAESKLKRSGLSAQFSGSGETVTGQLPAPGQMLPPGSEVLLYLGEKPDVRMVEMPDFSGMNRQQAADTAGKLGLYLLVSGNDGLSPQIIVIAQDIPAGTQVEAGTTVTLEFTDTAARD